jgi:hypothetical protein
MQTLLYSVPALANVGVVLLLIFFVFAVMGMSLFGSIKWGTYVNRHANFTSFPVALLTLFRMITGENWNGIMQVSALAASCCTASCWLLSG